MTAFTNQGPATVPADLRRAIWAMIEQYAAEENIDAAPESVSGLLEWSFDPAAGSASATSSQGSGRIAVAKVPLRKARRVTAITVRIQTGGATLTAGQNLAGLYTPAGAKIAGSETADQSGNWVNAGLHTMALAGGPITITPHELRRWIWVALLTVGTTPPLWRRSTLLPQCNDGTLTHEKRFGLDASTGNTALPASLTPATMADFDGVWAALS